MSSGMREMVINPLERALSDDINRLQKFKSKDLAELFRYWMNVLTSEEYVAGIGGSNGNITEYNSLEAPLRAEIVNGLCVLPQIGSNDCFVTPGVMFALFPDAAPDDSNYKFATDVGVQVSGSITIAANPTGSKRVDVIECQPTFVTEETSNRDIYDPSTDTYNATTVPKVQRYRLTYRVRSGTSGGGFASVGVVAGWLPLAVASVPAGSTNNDTVTFFDVRPLLADRPSMFNRHSSVDKYMPENWFYTTAQSSSVAIPTIAGVAKFVHNGRVVGGTFLPGQLSSVVQGWASPPAAPNSLTPKLSAQWLCFPFGLPRWCQYTLASAGSRVPGSYRGILLVNNVLPLDATGVPSAPLNIDSAGLELGGTTDAVLVAAFPYGGGVEARGGRYQFIYAGTNINVLNSSFITGTSYQFTVTMNDSDGYYPANAKATYMSLNVGASWNDANAFAGTIYAIANVRADDSPFPNPAPGGFHSYISGPDPLGSFAGVEAICSTWRDTTGASGDIVPPIIGKGIFELQPTYPGALGSKLRTIFCRLFSASGNGTSIAGRLQNFGATIVFNGYQL